MRSLVVDDEQEYCELMKNFLGQYGECVTITEGSMAVQLYDEAIEQMEPFDMVSLDIIMPGMDGHETLKELRKVESNSTIPVSCEIIMHSAFYEKQSIYAAYKNGANAYIPKPLDTNLYIEKLRELHLVS